MATPMPSPQPFPISKIGLREEGADPHIAPRDLLPAAHSEQNGRRFFLNPLAPGTMADMFAHSSKSPNRFFPKIPLVQMIRRPFQADKYSASPTSVFRLRRRGLLTRPGGQSQDSSSSEGFSLIELLVVMGILAVLMVALLPKIASIGTSQSITQAYGAIPDLLRQARSYAMANNTYVYVGILEADASKSNTGTQTSGTGRIYVGLASSKDGTSGITGGGSLDVANLTSLAKLQAFDGVSLVSSGEVNVFPTDQSGNPVDVDSASSAASFSWADVGSKAIGTVKFDKVLQFAPDGTANMIGSATVASYLRMGFVPTHGNKVDANGKNVFGIQIDGLTGAVRAFRAGQS